MHDFYTIATFVLPTEMAIAKSKLESEGIECKVLDELTVQTYNFLSQAIGGVKLQVMEQDVDKARAILEANGFLRYVRARPTQLEEQLSDPRNMRIAKIVLFSLLAGVILLGIGLMIRAYSST